MISGYNGQPQPVNNFMTVVAKEIKIKGFLVFSLYKKYHELFFKEVPQRLASGELTYKEDAKKGLEFGGHAIEDVQRGRNFGKSVVVVAEN